VPPHNKVYMAPILINDEVLFRVLSDVNTATSFAVCFPPMHGIEKRLHSAGEADGAQNYDGSQKTWMGLYRCNTVTTDQETGWSNMWSDKCGYDQRWRVLHLNW
jgi:hypothetical protein